MWKRALAFAALAFLFGEPAFAARTLYTVVMCDTAAKNVEQAATDCGNLFLTMVRAFKSQGISCADPAYIPGQDVSTDEVRRRIAAYPIDNDDTLLFYYVGHGKSRNGVHILDTSHGEITRDEMRTTLLSAPRVAPRLTVMLTECCANESNRKSVGMVPMFGLSLGEQVPNKSLLDNLLFSHSGVVDITSSSYDEFSIAKLFSLSLKLHMEAAANFDTYDLNQDGFVAWREFFPSVVRTTNALYQKNIEGEAQETQIPFAFSLGTASKDTDPDIYAANFGFHFTVVATNFKKNAAKLTRNPAPNTPAARIGLKAGDLVDTLDDLPIWGPIDVFNHHLDTKVLFVRGAQPLVATAFLPEFTPYPADVPPEQYSNNFVMSYHLIPFGKRYGVRLTRKLVNTSPLSRLGLEPGDMIVKIGGEWIQTVNDVTRRRGPTEIVFIDVRTALPKRAVISLP